MFSTICSVSMPLNEQDPDRFFIKDIVAPRQAGDHLPYYGAGPYATA